MTPSSYSCSCCRPSSHPLNLLLFKLLVFGAFVSGMATASKAQDKVELFGGYSYFRASIPEMQYNPVLVRRVSEDTNLNGVHLSAQYKFLRFFGGVADFNATYGKLRGAGTREKTFLLGPQVSLPYKISPFAHALFGLARESQDAIPTTCPITVPTCSGFASFGSDTSWASAVGGGLDWGIAPFVAVRVLQIDSVHTHLHGVAQNQPRVSAGVVFRF